MSKYIYIYIVVSLSLHAQLITRTQVLMSTFVSISVDKKYDKELEKAFDIMRNVENSLSSYDSTATVFLLNKNKKVKIDKNTYEALVLSTRYYKESDGYFNIAIGSITKDMYRFGEDERLVPLSNLQKTDVDFYGLKFNKKEALLADGIKIDLGGMGKGFSVDKVVKYFKQQGIKDAVIKASGDIRCLGICNVDIQDPFSDGFMMSFKTTKDNLGISTSGTYNRYVKSQKYNHLINPKKKKSQDKFVSITLVGAIPSADLDAYATAASVMPLQKAYSFLDLINVAYIVVQSDGVVKKGGDLELIIFSDTLKK